MTAVLCGPADPEAKGDVEWANGYLETSSLPGRRFEDAADFNRQLEFWLRRANQRIHGTTRVRPAEVIWEDRGAILAFPGVLPDPSWRFTTRLPRAHYVRVETNHYSVNPRFVGRRVDVRVTLDEVVVTCDGNDVARHNRCLASHQSLLAADHARILRTMRAEAELAAAIGTRSKNEISPTTTERSGSPNGHQSGDQTQLRSRLPLPSYESPVARGGGHSPRGERARSEGWTHEEFLAARLEREVARPPGPWQRRPHQDHPVPPAARPSKTSTSITNGPSNETRFPISGPSISLPAKRTSSFSARPARAKPTSTSASESEPAKLATASRSPPPPWVARLAEAHAGGRLHAELTRLGRVPLVIIDEVGYSPFEADGANLFFQFVSARYERASVIVASNKPFGRWAKSSATPSSPPP